MKITKIAVKTPNGIKTAFIGKHHKDIGAKGQRGFIADSKFVSRSEATKIARKSGQTNTKKPLHSHLLTK